MTTTTTTTTEDHGQVHVYDGIEEHDNRLPRWWLMTLWGAIGFAFAYWGVYEIFHLADGPRASFDKEMVARAVVADAARLAHADAAVDDDKALADASHDKDTVERGRAVYASTCLACHMDKGQGLVGPNLTDDAWLHGDSPSHILVVVSNGVVDKGMPAWGPALGTAKVRDVVAYVLTLKGTHVVGKAPQGTVVAVNN